MQPQGEKPLLLRLGEQEALPNPWEKSCYAIIFCIKELFSLPLLLLARPRAGGWEILTHKMFSSWVEQLGQCEGCPLSKKDSVRFDSHCVVCLEAATPKFSISSDVKVR